MDNKIKTLRDYIQLSQAAFAKPLDLSPTHIARFEQGIAKPSQSTIDRICESFHVDPRYFGTSQPSQLSQLSGTQLPGAQLSGAEGAQLPGCGGPRYPEHQVLKGCPLSRQ